MAKKIIINKNPQKETTINDLLVVVNSLSERMSKGFVKIDDRFTKIDNRFDEIDNRFVKIDDRFTKIDNRFDEIDNRFVKIDDRFTKIDNRFDGIDDRFTKIDNRFDGIDDRFAKQEISINKQFVKINDRFAEQEIKMEKMMDEKIEGLAIMINKSFEKMATKDDVNLLRKDMNDKFETVNNSIEKISIKMDNLADVVYTNHRPRIINLENRTQKLESSR